MKNIYLFRHGQTDWNKARKFQGRADIPLNDTGRKQAHELIGLLGSKSLDILMTSPLQRAYETAAIIGSALKVGIESDPRLMEVDLGEDDGCTYNDLIVRTGEDFIKHYLTSWKDEDMDLKLSGGETKREAQKRALSALTEIAESGRWNNIGVACHGLIMMLLLGHAGVDKLYPMGNGDIVHLIYTDDRQWRFHEYINNPLEAGSMY